MHGGKESWIWVPRVCWGYLSQERMSGHLNKLSEWIKEWNNEIRWVELSVEPGPWDDADKWAGGWGWVRHDSGCWRLSSDSAHAQSNSEIPLLEVFLKLIHRSQKENLLSCKLRVAFYQWVSQSDHPTFTRPGSHKFWSCFDIKWWWCLPNSSTEDIQILCLQSHASFTAGVQKMAEILCHVKDMAFQGKYFEEAIIIWNLNSSLLYILLLFALFK